MTLWQFNIAMENCQFIDDVSSNDTDLPWLCSITRGHNFNVVNPMS